MKYSAVITANGLNFGKNDEKFREKMKKMIGKRVIVETDESDSPEQRRFFEGAVVRLATFFQEDLDYKDWHDVKLMKEAIKVRFNAEFVRVGDEVVKVGGSTKGKLNDGLCDAVQDWLEEQYGIRREIVLNPKEFKKWRDEIFSFTNGPDNFIDYQVQKGLLKKYL